MFRKSEADEIDRFYASPLQKNEVVFFYLGVSGFIIRSLN
jgi:hypothetical protein